MTEVNCDAYMVKLAEIKILCEDANTTKQILQTKLGEIQAIDTAIENDLLTMDVPATLTHLNKFILVQIERSRKSELHKNLLNVIECKDSFADEYQQTHTYDELLAYLDECKTIDNYIHNEVIPSCSCMNNRKEIIKNQGKAVKKNTF